MGCLDVLSCMEKTVAPADGAAARHYPHHSYRQHSRNTASATPYGRQTWSLKQIAPRVLYNATLLPSTPHKMQ
ncbi:hypothetical protein P8C59_004741 [Phyllachora maydis]|uniref:Uncharacterized protein n=1 Tax=Phyllachora maydis TaxID=1825666 RepID=A0AAD9MAR7_9PEZI|nr:hypothetical protein P8C59_004741 [Phyllachora maydis]